MKSCRSCGIEKEVEQFYRRPSNSDGLYSYCKECTLKKSKQKTPEQKAKQKEQNLEYKEKNREKVRRSAREYYWKNRQSCLEKRVDYREKNKAEISFKEALKRLSDDDRFEKNRQKHLTWSKANREKLNEYQREWYQKNKEKRRAHVILNRSVKSGTIMRPDKCSECGKSCKPDGHHVDYNQPLDVIWICRACHARKSPRTVIR